MLTRLNLFRSPRWNNSELTAWLAVAPPVILVISTGMDNSENKRAAQELFSEIVDAEELIGRAVGAASTCWENLEAAGEFDASKAVEISRAAYARLQTILADRFSSEPAL